MARKPPKPAMSVTNVKNIFDANAGSNPSFFSCLLYTSPSPRDDQTSRMPSSA